VTADHPLTGPDRTNLGAAIEIHATIPQIIREVPIINHCIIMVQDGYKEIAAAGKTISMAAGDLILLHAGSRPNIGNYPNPASGHYRARGLAFGPQSIQAFQHQYPALAAKHPRTAAPWEMRTGDTPLAATVLHAAEGLGHGHVSEQIARHRCVEVLVAMAERGLYLPRPDDELTSTKVQALIASRPGIPWSAADAARALGVSEATLRRHLAAEARSFRQIVSDVRLSQGLHLVQTTTTGIVHIALECGYESPSRFTARFKERFGVSPSELRGTSLP
jgi:AraC-like DNA-binding protein